MTTKITMFYRKDILGKGYEKKELKLPDDYEGQVISTLIRKKTTHPSKKAVLYIHGFIDYFFQTEMAEKFNDHGFDFYALDLRKYGRSYLAHQKFFNVRSLSEYDAEISMALNIIAHEGHHSVLLCGHSTGGLITTLYAAHHLNDPLIKGLWLNSPFFDFNLSYIEKNIMIPCLSKIGKTFPNNLFPNRINQWYVPSIHKMFYGEWSFDLEWKKEKVPYVQLGFIHAIHQGHKEIHTGPYLSIPTLIMHSDQTTNPSHWCNKAQNSDIVLDVKDIKKWALKLKGHITLCEIKNGIHDLVLSQAKVRNQVYNELFKWIKVQNL